MLILYCMAIKNSDGSIFKLNGPIPVMKEQKTWNGYVLHNMEWNPYSFGSEDNNVSQEKPVKKDPFIEELERNPPKQEEAVKQEEVPPPKQDKKITIPTTLCYCLPTKVESKVDSLYDEVRKTISYDTPFVLEIVITEETDFNFECWTTVKNIDFGSILYPKNKMKRWWSVSHLEEKSGGFLIKCVISPYQPAFSD